MSRIFLLDATILKIYINDTIIGDAQGDTNFHVKIDLIDIPSLTINRNEFFENSESCDDNCNGNLDFYAGRACHFVSSWSRISQLLKKKPLEIGVYRLNENFPICHGILPFSGCICDLVTKAMEESSPLEFRGIFNLVDPGGNPAGTISLAIILSDLGKHVVALFALDSDSFVVRNDLEGVEYVCSKLKESRKPDTKMNSFLTIDSCCGTKYARENLMSTIAGICLAAAELSHGKPVEKKTHEWSHTTEEQNDRNKEEPVVTRKKRSGKKLKQKKK